MSKCQVLLRKMRHMHMHASRRPSPSLLFEPSSSNSKEDLSANLSTWYAVPHCLPAFLLLTFRVQARNEEKAQYVFGPIRLVLRHECCVTNAHVSL